jgi:L-asparaginase II
MVRPASTGAVDARLTSAPPVLAEVVRAGLVEGRHRGSVVVLAVDGSIDLALGDVTSPMYPRSCAKVAQAAAVLQAGARLDGPLLALAAGSHSGEGFHLEGVRQILAGAGLGVSALRTPADLPYGDERAFLRAGGQAEPILMNCSGKHAAMLAACVANGWSTADYLAAGHPMQVLAREVLEGLAGERAGATGVDGCGAPVHAISLLGLARVYRTAVLSGRATPVRRVADAMRRHPEYVAGAGRIDTGLMRAFPGLLCKVGAEAVQAAALPDGRALAFKVDDGSPRAVGPVLAAVLRRAGLRDRVLDQIGSVPLFGGGRPVGEVRGVELG